MSTWSEEKSAIQEFVYPVVGSISNAMIGATELPDAEVAEEKLARREAYARQVGRQEGS